MYSFYFPSRLATKTYNMAHQLVRVTPVWSSGRQKVQKEFAPAVLRFIAQPQATWLMAVIRHRRISFQFAYRLFGIMMKNCHDATSSM